MITDWEHAQHFFGSLDFLIARHHGDFTFAIPRSDQPAWFQALFPNLKSQDLLDLSQLFPFLECFKEDALSRWTKQGGKTRSGTWTEVSSDGQEIFLEALALHLPPDEEYLLIGPRVLLFYNEYQDLLQKVRELHLAHESLEKTQTALELSERKNREVLNAIPDTFVFFDRNGRVANHNLPYFPTPLPNSRDGRNLYLTDMLPENAAILLQSKANNLNAGDEMTIIDYSRNVGDMTHFYQARLVPMIEDSCLAVISDVTAEHDMERRRREFLSVASHELRTPLTAIACALELTSMHTSNMPDKVQNLVQIADRSCRRLVRLVNDLLDIQRIEAGAQKFHFKKQPINDVVRQVVDENTPLAQRMNISLSTNLDLSNPFAAFDADAMTQVITNLVSNALKFSPSGSQVIVHTRIDGQWLNISVEDQGPGIPLSHQDRVFKKFASIPHKSTEIKGTGLGLSICKAIIDMHHGKIDFVTSEGHGTTFTLTLARIFDMN